jgi:hypothetical protein
VTSALVGVVCLGLAGALGWSLADEPSTPPVAVLVWLGYINFGLAVFNLIPGYPLDGGRVLRALVWGMTGDAARATRISARIGQATAFAFIILGLLRFFGGAGLGGLWIVFIGWFLLTAAGASYGRVEMLERLQGLQVGDVMSRDCDVVPATMSIDDLVDGRLLRSGRRCFTVVEGGARRGAHHSPRSERDPARSLGRVRRRGSDAPLGPAPHGRAAIVSRRGSRGDGARGRPPAAGGSPGTAAGCDQPW